MIMEKDQDNPLMSRLLKSYPGPWKRLSYTDCFPVDFCNLLKVIYFRNLKHCHRTVLPEGRILNRRKWLMFHSLVEIFLCTTFGYFLLWPSKILSYLEIFAIACLWGYIGLCMGSVLMFSVNMDCASPSLELSSCEVSISHGDKKGSCIS